MNKNQKPQQQEQDITFTQVLWHLKQNGMPFALWTTIKSSISFEQARSLAKPYLNGFTAYERYLLWTFIQREIDKRVYEHTDDNGYIEEDENAIDPETGYRMGFRPQRVNINRITGGTDTILKEDNNNRYNDSNNDEQSKVECGRD